MSLVLEQPPLSSPSYPLPYRFGPLISDTSVSFRLWAPGEPRIDLVLEGRAPIPMIPASEGFLVATVDDCRPGTRYQFCLGDLTFPDPASRQQEWGTRGWSILCAPLAPSGRRTPIRPWHETVVCEVHVGTVTPQGTFEALRRQLEHFRDAGYTCLELMPVNQFPGSRNWGYDGTLIFAPATAYGTPEELRALVDRAHELGLCMVLDVVYNHFGGVDNFIPHYAPEWFDEEQETPWGPGINFDAAPVRRFYYENAAMWLAEYDFDGLRFDSVHEIKDERFLGELAEQARAVKHHAKLIIENMENSARWLERDERNEPKTYAAQWDDDMHHVLAFLAAGEKKHGYDNRSRDAIGDLEKVLLDGFVHDGDLGGEADKGEGPASRLPPDAFIAYVQNHDQIGNRADAQRIADRTSAARLDFLHFLLFMMPQIPLFFMGEEAHMRTPFPFFCDLPEDAAEKVRSDRYTQMREFFEEKVKDGELPDPNDPQTFAAARLRWREFGVDERQAALARFRTLSRFRRELVWPLAATPCMDARSVRSGNCLIVNWVFEAGTLSMVLNPTDTPQDCGCLICGHPVSTGDFSQNGDVLRLGPWTAVAWAGGR